MPDGEFDWGGRLRKGIGGAQRFPQNGRKPFEECKGRRPHIKSVLILTCLLRVIWIFNGPEAIIAMTNGGPAGSSQIMTSYMYTLINSLDYGKASAIGVICTVILTLYTIFYLKITSLNKED